MSRRTPRNPGPTGGYRIILAFHRYLPGLAFRLSLAAGTWVAFLFMRKQRAHSREYLQAILGRPAAATDVWRHFYRLAEALTFRLVAGERRQVDAPPPEWEGEAFMKLVESPHPALFGTFHIGCSDLLGFLLTRHGRAVHMIRLKVENSTDTDLLIETHSGIRMIWVNNPHELFMGIKAAVDAGASLALQCDRPEFASKLEAFYFLGERRLFPFTIYHLSAIYRMPVGFCFALLDRGRLRTFAPPVFEPEGSKPAVLEAGRRHFQEVLQRIETLLHEHPYQWFNFTPLNPSANEQDSPTAEFSR